jgi:hypothetical protein
MQAQDAQQQQHAVHEQLQAKVAEQQVIDRCAGTLSAHFAPHPPSFPPSPPTTYWP